MITQRVFNPPLTHHDAFTRSAYFGRILPYLPENMSGHAFLNLSVRIAAE